MTLYKETDNLRAGADIAQWSNSESLVICFENRASIFSFDKKSSKKVG
jgi:hypothetical protein